MSNSIFTVVRVVTPHPDWDTEGPDYEREVDHFSKREDADLAAKKLGSSIGDATHRAYRHYVRETKLK